MPRYIVKFGEDQYLEWSTVVDAPVTYLMTRKDALDEYGKDRIERADAHGTSSVEPTSVDELIGFNRAGENETCLSKAKILEQYQAPLGCRNYGG